MVKSFEPQIYCLCIKTLILSVKMSKRKQFTVDEKLSLIKKYDEIKRTWKGNIRKFALEKDIAPISLQTILKKQDDLKKEHDTGNVIDSEATGSGNVVNKCFIFASQWHSFCSLLLKMYGREAIACIYRLKGGIWALG